MIKKNKEIKELKEENSKLKQMVIMWKQKFFDIINFIGKKIFNKHDREKYTDVTTDLFENDLIEYKTYDSIREDYDYSVKKNKNKDDLYAIQREMQENFKIPFFERKTLFKMLLK